MWVGRRALPGAVGKKMGFSYGFWHVGEVQRRGEDVSPVLAAQDVQCQTEYLLAAGELFCRNRDTD